MRPTPNLDPLSHMPGLPPRHPHPSGIVPALLSSRRGLLAVAMALMVLALALQALSGTRAHDAESTPPARTAASGVDGAFGTNQGSAPDRASALSQRQPGGTRPGLAATPTPGSTSPTPSTIRPLAIATMPPVPDSHPAPTRKPGTPDPEPTASHVIVVDGSSGSVLFEHNGYDSVAPASLTKIMTAILGIEHGNISDHVKTDVDATTLGDSTLMGLEPWFDVTLEDLLYGLMLPSGNDAALAIGRYVAGSDEAFVWLMNQKAAWLGLRSTHFANPHGLDDPDHYSSPYDMVVMARYGMQYPVFRELAKARSYDIAESNIAYTIYNLNPILGSYPGADGVKIGYTDNSGRSIVATAVKNDHRVYVAFMGSEQGLVPETTELLDWAFDSFSWP